MPGPGPPEGGPPPHIYGGTRDGVGAALLRPQIHGIVPDLPPAVPTPPAVRRVRVSPTPLLHLGSLRRSPTAVLCRSDSILRAAGRLPRVCRLPVVGFARVLSPLVSTAPRALLRMGARRSSGRPGTRWLRVDQEPLSTELRAPPGSHLSAGRNLPPSPWRGCWTWLPVAVHLFRRTTRGPAALDDCAEIPRSDVLWWTRPNLPAADRSLSTVV